MNSRPNGSFHSLSDEDNEVPRVLSLGICLDFHYFLTGVVFPKFGLTSAGVR